MPRIRGPVIAPALVLVPLLAPFLATAAEVQTYTYDAKGRLIMVQSSGSANGPSTTTYQYDQADNRTDQNTVLK